LLSELKEMFNNFLKLLFKLFFAILETINDESFIFTINLRNNMMSEMFNLMISQ